MGPIGADVEALHRLAGSMRGASRRLTEMALHLDRRARTTGWRGVDADRFAREWQARHRVTLLTLGDRCARLATSLDAQADEQRRASATTMPTATAAVPSQVLTERRYLGGIEVRAGVATMHLNADVSIAELGDGRSRLTLATTGGLGLAAGVGSTAQLSISDEHPASTPVTGAQAELRGRLGAVERRSWVLDDRDVDRVLGLIAANEIAATAAPTAGARMRGLEPVEALPGAGGAARFLGGLLDEAAEHLAGFDPGVDDHLEGLVTIPEPQRVERLLEVEILATAGAAAVVGRAPIAPAGQLAATGALRSGTSVERGRRATVVEYSGGLSASLSTAILARVGVTLPDALRSTVAMRLELAETPDGSRDQIVLREVRGDGSALTERTTTIELGDHGADTVSDSLRVAVRRLAAGDPAGALDAVRRIVATPGLIDQVTTTITEATVTGTTARLSGSGGAGAGLGVTARGQVLDIERRS